MTDRWEPPREVEEYKVIRVLGRGAMGEVWLAHDTLLDRPVAMKFIRGGHADANARFFSEARAIARLDHPNVIRIHRVGEVDGRPFLVSEYLRGDALDRVPRPIPLDSAHEVALGLARGLAAAHRRGVLHRDVKPANAFRTEDKQIKLLDFGLAKVIDEAGVAIESEHTVPDTPRPSARAVSEGALDVTLPGSSGSMPASASSQRSAAIRSSASLDATMASSPRQPSGLDVTLPGDSAAQTPRGATTTNGARSSMAMRTPRTSAPTLVGSLMGTPSYLAPELWSGKPATMASDVYALGATLYELLSGGPPHVANDMTLLAQMVRTREIPPLATLRPEIPASLAKLVQRCLERDPSKRFGSADEVCAELESIARESAQTEVPPGNPFRGLSAFDEHHSRMFFGRDREIAELADRLRSEPWLVVAGRSGAGKSSVVRAGLVPRIRRHGIHDEAGWRVIAMTPGEQPMAALAMAAATALGKDAAELAARLREDPAALANELRADRDHGTVLLVDQLEELVTLASEAERERFVEALVPAMLLTPKLRVIATIRSDFVGQLDLAPALARQVARSLYLLGPLERDGLRAAIVAPLAVHGVTFERESDVEALIESATKAPGGLPLLEFALARLWELRDAERGVIPHDALAAIGGIEGALAQHADDVIGVLSPAAREATRRVALRLVSADRTRIRRGVRELVDEAPADQRDVTRTALEALVQGRLLAVGDEERGATYELAHEALITHWTRLRVWLEEADVDQATRERIELAATDWDRQGRPADGLWRGQQLGAIDGVPLSELGTTAREFVVRGRRARRRTQVLRRAILVSGFAVLSTWLGIAMWLNNRAGVARDRAEVNASMARAQTAALYQEQGRQALIAGEAMRAVAYFVEAYETGQRSPELTFLLDRASGTLDGDLVHLKGHGEELRDLAWSADGTLLATASIDQTARVWRASDGQQLAELRHRDEVRHVRFSPDQQRVATASFDGTAAIWQTNSGEQLHRLPHDNRVVTVDWFASGQRLVTASMDATAKVWDTATGQTLATLRAHTDRLVFAHVNQPGDRIITGSFDKLAILWDATTYQQVARLEGHRGTVWRAAFSDDGRRVVTGSDDHTARVWDAATGALVATFAEHVRNITHLAFSPDGEHVVSASEDGTVRVWRATTGASVATFRHGVPVWHVAFSPDGTRVVTSSGDGVAAQWRIADSLRLWTFVGHTDTVWRAAFSPDGKRIATGSADRTARVWDASRSAVELSLPRSAHMLWDARFDQTGDRLLTAADDQTVTVWDRDGRSIVTAADRRVTGHPRQPLFARWSPRGDWFVTLNGMTVEQRDARTANLLRTFATQKQPSRLATPSRDARSLAYTDDTIVHVVDPSAPNGAPSVQLRGHERAAAQASG